MKLYAFKILPTALSLILSCAGLMAQDADETEKSQPPGQMQLESELKRLNDLIDDAPSRLHHRRADVLFRLGRFEESIEDYNAAARFGRPHNEDSCWERGLAQYYVGDFRGGRDQFTRYHSLGPTDVENGIWRFLCVAEDEGLARARETMLDYRRKRGGPFPALLRLYMGEGDADENLEAARKNVNAVIEDAKTDASSQNELTANLFFAHYYLAKYYEIIDQQGLALRHVREALTHELQHFMYACAEIDAKRIQARQKPLEATGAH